MADMQQLNQEVTHGINEREKRSLQSMQQLNQEITHCMNEIEKRSLQSIHIPYSMVLQIIRVDILRVA